MENGVLMGASLYRQNSQAKTNFTKAKTLITMKKPANKLSLKTDKVVSLSTSSMQNVQGGFPPTTIRPSNSGQSYNCIKAPSNSGQSYNC